MKPVAYPPNEADDYTVLSVANWIAHQIVTGQVDVQFTLSNYVPGESARYTFDVTERKNGEVSGVREAL